MSNWTSPKSWYMYILATVFLYEYIYIYSTLVDTYYHYHKSSSCINTQCKTVLYCFMFISGSSQIPNPPAARNAKHVARHREHTWLCLGSSLIGLLGIRPMLWIGRSAPKYVWNGTGGKLFWISRHLKWYFWYILKQYGAANLQELPVELIYLSFVWAWVSPSQFYSDFHCKAHILEIQVTSWPPSPSFPTTPSVTGQRQEANGSDSLRIHAKPGIF